jgi:MFS family permease
MLDAYRTILSRPGTALFSGTGLVARLPMSMVGLGIVLLVSDATDSYGLAGAITATYLTTNAVLSVVQGRLLDRLGQAPVLAGEAVIFCVGLGMMAVSVQFAWPRPWTFGLAAIAGVTVPAIGGCVRARWSHVLSQPTEVHTAYALESVLDEVVFIVGPILVTALATAWHPLAGLGAAILAAFVGTLAFAAQKATQPPANRGGSLTRPESRLPWVRVVAIGLVALSLGALFGSAEVSTVAFTEELDQKRYAGALLALWAAGSLIAGVITGAIRFRQGPASQLRLGTAALAATMAPLPFIDNIWVMSGSLFVGGFAVAPTLIATMSLTEQTVPGGRLTEGMAIVHTGIAAGVAVGAAASGVLIDSHGASLGFFVSLAAGAVAALGAQTSPR